MDVDGAPGSTASTMAQAAWATAGAPPTAAANGAAAGVSAVAGPPEPAAAPLVAFAVVDEVTAGSPADTAGIQVRGRRSWHEGPGTLGGQQNFLIKLRAECKCRGHALTAMGRLSALRKPLACRLRFPYDHTLPPPMPWCPTPTRIPLCPVVQPLTPAPHALSSHPHSQPPAP